MAAHTEGVDTGGAGVPGVSAWPGVVITGPLAGGARAAVYAARRGQERLVVKVSLRAAASLDWELELLLVLDAAGVTVPARWLRMTGGGAKARLSSRRSCPVSRRGPPPTGAAVAVITRAHEVTRGWPQRPGSASAAQLMTVTRGADVDLAAMPAEVVALVRACWAPLLAQSAALKRGEPCVVHGDLGTGALLVDGDTVGIIDWDEARVDVPGFDFADLAAAGGGVVEVLGGLERQVLIDAALAWEVATCWVVEPTYARQRLRELQQRTGPTLG